MWGYYFKLAWMQLRRTPWLALLIGLSLAVGIAASMTTLTLRHVLALDPIPGKSDRLLTLQDPEVAVGRRGKFSYVQAGSLAHLAGSHAESLITGAGVVTSLAVAGQAREISQGVGIRYASRSIFDVFDIPVIHGRSWTPQEESNASPVLVMDEGFAQELFPAGDALGGQVRIGETLYTVIGISAFWNPRPRYYNLDGVAGAFGGGGDAIFMPLTTIRFAPEQLMVSRTCPGNSLPASTPSELAVSPCRWLDVWYLAHRRQDVPLLFSALRGALPSIVSQTRASHLQLRDVNQLLLAADIVPGPVRLYAKLGLAFLLLCVINAAGMQLSRVLREGSQIGIRRALGASRREVIKQHLCDALLLSGLGGAVGVGLTLLALQVARGIPAWMYADLARMDGVMMTLMLALVLVCGLLVGVVPAWLASRADPALLVKLPQ